MRLQIYIEDKDVDQLVYVSISGKWYFLVKKIVLPIF